MFEQSILVRQGTSKPWSVLLSLAAELAGIGLLVVTPLIWAQRLPLLAQTRIAVWLSPVHDEAPVHPAPPGPRSKCHFGLARPIFAPPAVPDHVNIINDPLPEPTGLETLSGQRGKSGIDIADLVERTPEPPKPPPARHTADTTPATPPTIVRVSKMDPAKLLYKVVPVYPRIAIATHTEGTVYLLGIVGTDGTIQSLRVLKGHPLLVAAALDAVRQWRYKPTVLNGQAVEVEAPISVTFTLQ